MALHLKTKYSKVYEQRSYLELIQNETVTNSETPYSKGSQILN